MTWDLEERDSYVIARMNSNKVNMINRAFFADVHAFATAVEREFPGRPVVLTSASPKAFSAGLDFDEAFSLLDTDNVSQIQGFFDAFREVYLRLFTLGNPIIGAASGPAIAGGLILFCCCDFRFATRGARFALNEIPLGLPMPAAYSELLGHVLGSRFAEELILGGRMFDADEALRFGVIHEVAEPDALLERACARAQELAQGAMSAYRTTKTMIRGMVAERAEAAAVRYDKDLIAALMTEDCVRARQAAVARLKNRRGS